MIIDTAKTLDIVNSLVVEELNIHPTLYSILLNLGSYSYSTEFPLDYFKSVDMVKNTVKKYLEVAEKSLNYRFTITHPLNIKIVFFGFSAYIEYTDQKIVIKCCEEEV